MFQPIRCIHVDISQPPRVIDNLTGYSKVRALVLFDSEPIGSLTVPVINGRCRTHTISELARQRFAESIDQIVVRRTLRNTVSSKPIPLSRIADWSSSRLDVKHEKPKITIAVCTRDRPERLTDCLTAIYKSRGAAFELLVIDNAPATSATHKLVEQSFPNARYILEPRPGLDWARNRAIAESTTEIIAYADDDVVVDPHWAKRICEAFQLDQNIMCVTGLVQPYELETEAQWLFEEMGGFGRGFQRKWYRVDTDISGQWWYQGSGRFGTGANMAFRTSIFTKIGPFDPALDVGTPTGGAGDLEMFFRVLHEGHTLLYEPSAIVLHQHRRTIPELSRQLRDNGAIYSYFYKAIQDYPDQFGVFFKLTLWFLFFYQLPRLIASLSHKSLVNWRLYFAEIWGAIGSVNRYRKSERLQKAVIGKHGSQTGCPRRPKPIGLKFSSVRKRAVNVCHFDITTGKLADQDAERFGSTRVFAEWDGSSIGHVDIANSRRPLATEEVLDMVSANLADQLAPLLEKSIDTRFTRFNQIFNVEQGRINYAELEANEKLSPSTKITIVIATYDRPDDLRTCLKALLRYKTRRPVEIIVVDNHPTSGVTANLVEEFARVKYVPETRKGSSYARNTGICASTGDIIITIDDDVIVSEDWLEKIILPFTRADVMAVTGNILPLDLSSYSQWQFEAYGGLGRGYSSWEVGSGWFDSYKLHAVPTWRLGATANAAFRASIFADPAIGLMKESLGAGMPSGVGEDSYLLYKIAQAGHTIYYEPDAHVWHKHRSQLSALRKQIFNYSKGHICHHLTTLFEDRDLRSIWHTVVILPLWRVKQLLLLIFEGALLPGGTASEFKLAGSLVLTEIAGNSVGVFAFIASLARAQQLGKSKPYILPNLRLETNSPNKSSSKTTEFSIVIPCYNCENIVHETLDSVLAQSFTEWEAILVDDGSKDGTVSIIEQYAAKDSRFRVICQPNSGVSVARNNGLADANLDWILFLDSDDWIKPNYLQRMAEVIGGNPQIDLVHCGWTGVTPEGSVTEPRWFLSEPKEALADNSNEAFFAVTARVCPFIIHAAVVRRSILLKTGGFDQTLRTSEDWDLWQRVARVGANKFGVSDVLASYRMRPGSLTRSGIQMLRDGLKVLRRGHSTDDRLIAVPAGNTLGAPPNEMKLTQAYLALWAAGAIIGSGGCADAVIDEISDLKEPLLDCVDSAEVLLNAIILGACRNSTDAQEVLGEIYHHLWSFLLAMEKQTQHGGFARSTMVAAERYAILRALGEPSKLPMKMPRQACSVGQTVPAMVDITRPIEDIVAYTDLVDRAVVVVNYSGIRIGVVELPVIDGVVSGYVLRDTIAAKYAEQILRLYFEWNIYENVSAQATPAGYNLNYDDDLFLLRIVDADLRSADLFWAIGFNLFSYELFRKVYIDNLRDPAGPINMNGIPTVEYRHDKPVTIELANKFIPAVLTGYGYADLIVTVGGLPLGIVKIESPDEKTILPRQYAGAILELHVKELMRMVVRDAIIGLANLDVTERLQDRLRDQASTISGDIDRYVGLEATSIANAADASKSDIYRGIAGITDYDVVQERRHSETIGASYSRRGMLRASSLRSNNTRHDLIPNSLDNGNATADQDSGRLIYTPEIITQRVYPRLPDNPLSDYNRTWEKLSSGPSSVFTKAVPILMYHRVAPGGHEKGRRYRLSPEEFEAQLSLLRSEGFYTISLDEWQNKALKDQILPGRPIILTFDDGYTDFAEHAWPLLKRYGMTATVFLVTEHVGVSNSWETYFTESLPLMDWHTIRELSNEGCFFGSHTAFHPRLTSLKVDEIAREAIQSKATIESEIGREINTIAYPFGDVDQVVEHVFGTCGYTIGLGIKPEIAQYWDSMLDLPRIEISGLQTRYELAYQLERCRQYEIQTDALK